MNQAALSVKGARTQQGSLDRQAEANLRSAKILVSFKPSKQHIQAPYRMLALSLNAFEMLNVSLFFFNWHRHMKEYSLNKVTCTLGEGGR